MRRAILVSFLALLVFQQLHAQEVRVRQDTAIRSGPSDESYANGLLRAGATVKVLKWPEGGSRYAMIEAPANSISLVPAGALDHIFNQTKKPGTSHAMLRAERPLIDGTPGNETYLSGAKDPIPKNALVVVEGEKQILDPVTKKHNVKYYQIRAHGGEYRFIHADHLEGGPAYSQPNIPSLTTPPGSGIWDRTHSPAAPPPSDLGEIEQLPPTVINDIHAADLAYREAITTRAWEDARQRYNQMTLSPYASVRILAINRLEFIRQWQLNPQPVLPTRQLAEGVTAGMPLYPPTSSMWTPGDGRPSTPASLTNNVTPKQVIIRPVQPPVVTNPAAPAVPQLTSNPTYTGSPIPHSYQQPQASVAPVNGKPVTTPPPPPLANTVKQSGQLRQAAQYDGFNPLFYLTSSQGTATYYVKAVTSKQINLANYVGRYVEVEGSMIDRRQELGKEQINVVSIKEMQR